MGQLVSSALLVLQRRGIRRNRTRAAAPVPSTTHAICRLNLAIIRVLTVDPSADYTLSNPDTLTKYKTAAQISHRVLEAVSGIGILPLAIPRLADRMKDGVPRAPRYYQYASGETRCWRRK